MKYRFYIYFLVSIVLPCFAQTKEYIDLATHETRFIEVQPNIRLEVLDWKRQGKSIVFLSGLGNSGHVFDEFVNHFTTFYHVVAISRRGFGHSSRPDSGYDATTRAKDIKVILDSLSVEKAILIGHSIGGDELSVFSKLFPNRVEKLIYLDAYNYGDQKLFKIFKEHPFPNSFSATKSDSISLLNYTAFMVKVFGIRMPLSEIMAITQIDSLGRYIGDTTPDSIQQKILQSKDFANFEKIETPSLLFFASAESDLYRVPFYKLLHDSTKIKYESFYTALRKWQKDQISQFRKTMLNCKIISLENAHHYLFISNEGEVVNEIFNFLGDKK